MEFHFDHLSGKVMRIEDDWMTIRDAAGKGWSFYLTDFEPDVLIDEAVHALFGARNATTEKTFAALQNLNRGSVNIRPSHFKELIRPERYYALAAMSALLCCVMLFYFRNNTSDLFSLQNGFVMLILIAGWVFPLAILERKRLAYSHALTAYIGGLPPKTPPTPLLPSVRDDVEII